MLPTNESRENELSHDRERRLWFDYIAKLNDRSIQTARESGATNWVLLGAAVAILYNAVPQLPRWVSISNAMRSTLLVLLLEIDIFSFFAMAFVLLAYFSAGSLERRLLPKATERLHQITVWSTFVAFVTLAILGLWLAISYDARPIWIRWVLGGFGAWWALNIAIAVKKIFETSQAARKLKVPVPRFKMGKIGPNSSALIVSAITVVLGIIPLAALLSFLRVLNQSPVGWMIPLSVATHALVLCGVVTILLYRVLSLSHHAVFQNLERAIVVESLGPMEIRSRFVTQLLGTGVGDWLAEIMDGVKRSDAKLRACADTIRARLPEVESVNEQYSLERKGRANKLHEELQSAINEHRSAVQKFHFQVLEYGKVASSQEDVEILTTLAANLHSWVPEGQVNAQSAAELLKKLSSF